MQVVRLRAKETPGTKALALTTDDDERSKPQARELGVILLISSPRPSLRPSGVMLNSLTLLDGFGHHAITVCSVILRTNTT